jgi:hypothetical protein
MLDKVGRRFVGTVKTGSAEESLHAADLTDCTVVGDDGTTVRGRYDTPPSNSTPPCKRHAHHKGGSPMSGFAENGLTNAGCCVRRDGLDSAAERMANGRVEASMNIRNGMVAVGVCMIISSLLGRS